MNQIKMTSNVEFMVTFILNSLRCGWSQQENGMFYARTAVITVLFLFLTVFDAVFVVSHINYVLENSLVVDRS